MNTIVITGNLTESKGLRSTAKSVVAKRAIGENFASDESQFTDLEAWNNARGDLATRLDAFPKGAYVKVTGFLRHGAYVAKDGTNRRTSHVVVTAIEPADRPERKAGAGTGAAVDAVSDEEEVIVF